MTEELLGFKKKDAGQEIIISDKSNLFCIREEFTFPVVSKKDYDEQVALAIEIEESQNKVISNLEQSLAEKDKELDFQLKALQTWKELADEKDKRIAELQDIIVKKKELIIELLKPEKEVLK